MPTPTNTVQHVAHFILFINYDEAARTQYPHTYTHKAIKENPKIH